MAAEPNLLITVKVPKKTPENEKICITGNHKVLGNWKPDKVKMEMTKPNTFEFKACVPERSELEFKITRGTFKNVEKKNDGSDVFNRFIKIKPGVVNKMSCRIEQWADMVEKPEKDLYSLDIDGEYRVFENFESSYLEKSRHIIVFLPPNYDKPENSKKKYPVLYMHDGNNLFDPDVSYLGVDWGIDETVNRLVEAGKIPEIIVVGIYNSEDRNDEYSPFIDENGGGLGDNYMNFMINELKPFIDKKFRTKKDAKNTSIAGSSLGGLISLYIGVSRPDVFSSIMAISPAMEWANGEPIRWTLEQKIDPEKTKLWVDIGLAEWRSFVKGVRNFDKAFKKQFPDFKNYKYMEFPGAPHNELAWRERIHLPLLYVFGKDE